MVVPWFWWQKRLYKRYLERMTVVERLRWLVAQIREMSNDDINLSQLGRQLEHWADVSLDVPCQVGYHLATQVIRAAVRAGCEDLQVLILDIDSRRDLTCLSHQIVWFGLRWLGKSSLCNLFLEPDLKPDWRVCSWYKNKAGDNPPIYITRTAPKTQEPKGPV